VVDKKELNELRSVEELVSYQKIVEEGIKELDAESNGLPLQATAREEFASLVETNGEIKKRVKELEARRAIVAELAQDPAKTERAFSQFDRQVNERASAKEHDIYDLNRYQIDPSNPEKTRQNLRDGAMRAIEIAKFPTMKDGTRAQAHMERLLDSTQEEQPGSTARHFLTTGGPVYRKAFWKSVVGSVLDREEQRALSLAGSGGGFAIPFALDPSIIPTSNSVVNPARAIARLVTISGANTWQGVTSPAVVAAYAAEGTEASDNSTTLVQPQVTVQKAQTFVPFSIEVSEDWPALEGEFGRLIQDAKDDLEGAQFVTGVGTTVFPQGFVTGATTTFAFAAGSLVTFHAADIYGLEAALPPRFRPRESFVANRSAYNSIRSIDTAGGAALWLYVAQGLVTQAPTPGNTGATLLGRGAWEASAMTGKVAGTFTNADKVMIVGDFSYFLIVDRIGMTVELVPHIFGAANRFPIGQRGLYAYWRNSSKVLSASAFVVGTAAT
jgi:HK97 family phage major capsid protein